MKSEKLLTVFCPLYNKEKYIRRSFDSIFMQEADFDYEILVIDDCSTDNGVAIVEEYAAKFPGKITLLKNEKNIKTFATSLKGYHLIKTKYFTVLDPDDYWIAKDHMKLAVDFLEKNPGFTIYMADTFIQTEGDSEKKPYINSPSRNFFFNDLAQIVPGHTSATFFRTVFDEENLREMSKYVDSPDVRVFEGDSFRNFFHLKYGNGHFENEVRSLYNLNNGGIWTSLGPYKQDIENARFFFRMFCFFGKVQPDYFLGSAQGFIERARKKSEALEIEDPDFWPLYKEIIKSSNEAGISIKGINRDFCFFYPGKSVGGYEWMFLRMAKHLAQDLHFNVFYIDYEDGFVRRELSKMNSPVEFISYEDGVQKIIDHKAPFNIITSVTWAHQTPEFQNPNSKFIFYVAHPQSATWLKHRANMNDAELKNFFVKANEAAAIPFMDLSCFNSTQEKFDEFEITPHYIPVSVPQKESFANSKLKNDAEVNIAWLGRLDSDKIYSLINILDHFFALETPLQKNIHIIGDGNSKDLIDVRKYSSQINIVFTSTLLNENLESYLSENADILFAMGTSLLVGASLKIPSVLTLVSEREFSDDKFMWLFDLKGYTLGAYDGDLTRYTSRITSFGEIVSWIYDGGGKEESGEKSYDYFIKNHVIENTIEKLLTSTARSQLTYNKYQPRKIEKVPAVPEKPQKKKKKKGPFRRARARVREALRGFFASRWN